MSDVYISMSWWNGLKYCVNIVCTHSFWTKFRLSFLFLSFSHTLLVSILSPKYQSQLTNPLFFLNACMTSSRLSKIPMHAVTNETQVYYSYISFWYQQLLYLCIRPLSHHALHHLLYLHQFSLNLIFFVHYCF